MDNASQINGQEEPSKAVLFLIIGIIISLSGQALGSYGVCLQAAALKDEKNKKEVKDLAIVSHATNTPRSSLKPIASLVHSKDSLAIQIQEPELVANSNTSSRCSTPTRGPSSSMEAPLLVSEKRTTQCKLDTQLTPSNTSFREYAKSFFSPRKGEELFSDGAETVSDENCRYNTSENVGGCWPALRKRLHDSRWHIGLTLYIISQIFGSAVALAFLPTDLVAPLSNSSLFFNALFSRLMLGILITSWDVLGTVLVIVGAVLISCFGSTTSNADLNLDRLNFLYSRPIFLAYFITQLSLVLACLLFTKYLEYRLESDKPYHYAQVLASLRQQSLEVTLSQINVFSSAHDSNVDDERETGSSGGSSSSKSLLPSLKFAKKGAKSKKPTIDTARAQALIEDTPEYKVHSGKSISLLKSDHKIMKLPYHLLPVVCACFYSGIGGVLASQSILMAKSVILLFSDLLSQSVEYFLRVFFTNFLPPFLIVGTVTSLLTQLYSLNKCLALSPSLTMLTVPVFSTWYNALSLVNGIVYWDDWGFWQSHLPRLAICIAGVLLNVAGVLFLSFNKAKSEQETEQKNAARVSLLVKNDS